ncbi:hypothetical protein [Cupriavidus sp. D39]|uniref:hypothetical protein n=1 Tax=Cupriavidus sp. D39 TaxID=2997877 RepID=UPI00226F7331|nr:hypothetical protein [Cupriavidus sp. D39]MCY0855120.1 hypothetical protein [Cupriavidus sp. D39]
MSYRLPFGDCADFAEAARGVVAPLPKMPVRTAGGRVAWDLATFDFIHDSQAPANVNLSLWRLARQ